MDISSYYSTWEMEIHPNFVESQFLTSVPAFFQILDGSTMDVCGKSPAPAESCTTRGDQVLLGLGV